MSSLRVALLDHTGGRYAQELETMLRVAGHEPRLFGSRAVPALEALLRRRGFTPSLSHVPATVLGLLRGEFDVAHAFTAPDAGAAHVWRRATRGPAVFTCIEALERGTLANGRLRLSLLTRAVEESDAVTAASEEVRGAMERWLAHTPPVLPAADAAGYERLYRGRIAARAG